MNRVQLRWEDGRTTEFENPLEAWEIFLDDAKAWKLSWTTSGGKRMRVTKLAGNELEYHYVEDIIATEMERIRRGR